MMKTYMIFFVVALIASSQTQKISSNKKSTHQQPEDSTNKLYNVYKIDSINSFYLIYAKNGNSNYKIISKKEQPPNCNTMIQMNGKYEFKLHSQSYNPKSGKIEELPENSLLVNCFYYDDSTTICLERDSINDLFYGDNIKGLCYKNIEN